MTKDNSKSKNALAMYQLEKNTLDPDEARVFSDWLALLNKQDINYAVGGAFAIYAYTGLLRNTKDIDIYIKPSDLKQILTLFESAGYHTEITDNGWLAKVFYEDRFFMDMLFAIPRQRFLIEKDWFDDLRSAGLCDVEINVLAIEQLFVSKVFLAKSYRFDGADIVHLILSAKGNMRWQRILDYLGDEWELLLWYLLLFNFIYPGRANYLPQQLMVELFERVQEQWKQPPQKNKFRGTLLDPAAFEADWQHWGYEESGRNDPLVDKNGEVS